jgi:hypothetical protein
MGLSTRGHREAGSSLHLLNDAGDTVSRDGREQGSDSSIIGPNSGNSWLRALFSLVAIVVAAIVAFEVYQFRRRDLLATQAVSVGKVFIQSSPVVEEHLGRVDVITTDIEQHRSGSAPRRYVDFDVSGKRRSGIVEMRVSYSNDEWQIPSAQLKLGQAEVVSLR